MSRPIVHRPLLVPEISAELGVEAAVVGLAVALIVVGAIVSTWDPPAPLVSPAPSLPEAVVPVGPATAFVDAPAPTGGVRRTGPPAAASLGELAFDESDARIDLTLDASGWLHWRTATASAWLRVPAGAAEARLPHGRGCVSVELLDGAMRPLHQTAGCP